MGYTYLVLYDKDPRGGEGGFVYEDQLIRFRTGVPT